MVWLEGAKEGLIREKGVNGEEGKKDDEERDWLLSLTCDQDQFQEEPSCVERALFKLWPSDRENISSVYFYALTCPAWNTELEDLPSFLSHGSHL